MSYDLDVFDGDIDDEDGWTPLDPAVAGGAVGELTGITSAGDEWYWPVGALMVTLLLAGDEGQALSSIGVSVNVTGPATSDDLRRYYRQVLVVLLPLAARREARLFDHQLDEYVGPADLDAAVSSFAEGAA